MSNIPSIIHESWHPHIGKLFDDPKMNFIKTKILPKHQFYPDSKSIFRVFGMPLESIKVVILGQDPYYNGEAVGLSFAINEKSSKPKSLKIIEREIKETMSKDDSWTLDKTLGHWVTQRVFLLNAALTVEAGTAGSHVNYWGWFTQEVIKVIAKEVNPIWLLWGTRAQGFSSTISMATPQLVTGILKAPHPAAELYSGGKTTFQGCNHFNLCNNLLEEKEQTIINW